MAVILVVSDGQSNSDGGQGGDGGNQTTNSHVFAWDGSGWVVATLGNAPFVTDSPTRNNPGFNFCKRLQEETGDDVYLVQCAQAGTGIAAWDYPSGAQWQVLDTSVTDALASPEMTGKDHVDYFLWFQGEANPTMTTYKQKFLELRDACINSGWMTTSTPVIAGEIIDDDNLTKAALIELLVDGNRDWFNIAWTGGLEIAGNGPHFTGPSYVTIGRERFYDAAMALPRNADREFVSWNPKLTCSTTPTIDYDREDTVGGLWIEGDKITAWFRLTTTNVGSGGSGGLVISGIPSALLPSGKQVNSFSFPTYSVQGLSVNSGQAAGGIVLKPTASGIVLIKNSLTGNTMNVYPGELTNTFSIRGAVTYYL